MTNNETRTSALGKTALIIILCGAAMVELPVLGPVLVFCGTFALAKAASFYL